VSVRWAPRSWRDAFTSWTANDAPVKQVPIADMIEAGLAGYVLKLPAPTRLTPQQVATVTLPVLVIMAGASRMHDSAQAAATARATLRNGTVLVYPGASHAINGEQPDRIADDVRRFLDG
jgi:pimeloyl-ACP methyl ester carboxylesterase